MDVSLSRQRAAALAWATARLWSEGKLAEARWACEEALSLQHAAGSASGEASVRTTLGRVQGALGELSTARGTLEQALTRHRLDGDERLEALTLQELAVIALHEGRAEEAVSLSSEAIRSHERRGEAAFDVRARLRMAEALHAAGRLDEARTHLEGVRAAAEARGDQALRAACAADAGHLLHESGSGNDALRAYGLGLALCDAAPPWVEVDLRVGVARVRAERGSTDAAWIEATAAAELAASRGLSREAGVACATLAIAAARDGRLAEARDALDDARRLLEPIPPWIGLVEVAAGHVDLAAGDRDAAMSRMGAVDEAALDLVPVRLALRGLRTALGRPGD